MDDSASSDGSVLPTPAGSGAAGSSRVLVVEDDDSIGVPLVEGLEFEGFAPTRARTGAAAVEAADEPDFVLLDLGLPALDGAEVCRRVRARPSVPIIVVTEFGRASCRESGCQYV